MIEILWFVFDIALVSLLLALGWATCATQDVKRAVTLFIALGLLLAIIWARLKALMKQSGEIAHSVRRIRRK